MCEGVILPNSLQFASLCFCHSACYWAQSHKLAVWAGRLNYLLRILEVGCVSVSACLKASSNDKGMKWGGEGEVAEGEEQLVCNGCGEFLTDLIPLSADHPTVGIPFSPRDNGNSLLFISPPKSHLSIPPSLYLPHFSLCLSVACHGQRGDSQQKVHLNMMAGVYSQRSSTALWAVPDLALLSICDHVMEMDTTERLKMEEMHLPGSYQIEETAVRSERQYFID